MNETEQIIEKVYEYINNELPADVVHIIKRCILDYLGVVLGGSEENKERCKKYYELISRLGTSGNSTIFGVEKKADLYTAVQLNAFNAHILELDDGHRYGMLHLGASIITTVLMLDEMLNVSGNLVLKSIACGYEVAISLAKSIQPNHKLKGFHATGTCGLMGVAMASAMMLGLDKEQIRCALSAAGTSAAGLLEIIDDGSQLKPFNVSHAASAGLNAALIARVGYRGPNNIVSGKRGFLSAFVDNSEHLNDKIFSSNDVYSIREIYVKPYAACRHCHPAIEAVLMIRKELMPFRTNDIAQIIVETYKLAIYGHDSNRIDTINEAKMSTPYAVSVALIYGLCGEDAYRQALLKDKELCDLMQRVEIMENTELTRVCPDKRAAIVHIEMLNGKKYSKRIDYPKGEPENPLSDDEIESKFKNLAILNRKNEDVLNEIIDCVWNIEDNREQLYRLLG